MIDERSRNSRFDEKVISENIVSSALISQFRIEKISVFSTNTENVVLIAIVRRVLLLCFHSYHTSIR